MIHIYDGLTGSGKTYMLACDTLAILKRNKKWFEKGKTKNKRLLATNMALAKDILEDYEGYIVYWSELEQFIGLRECDIIFDDMGAYLDSQSWRDTPMSVKRWFRLHEHYGCDIYGNCQDFKTIDINVRRLTMSIDHIHKVIGSRRPSATKPEVKRIWGLISIRAVDEVDIDKEKEKREYKGLPRFTMISRSICEVFDTTQEIKQTDWPPLKHIERSCSECNQIAVRHV